LDNWIESVESKIGYTFNNKALLKQAFTHSSYTNEHRNFGSYERLEFIGDALLGYIIGVYLYNIYPNMDEGELSKKRAGLVNADTLAKVIDNLSIMEYLLVGSGASNDSLTDSVRVKCNIFESIIGAILLDSEMDITIAKKFILANLENKVNIVGIDYKSKILEDCAKKNKKAEFILLSDGNNEPYFKIALLIDGKQVCEGEGKSKKIAEKQASKIYYLMIRC
jgi:ribonuclease-3